MLELACERCRNRPTCDLGLGCVNAVAAPAAPRPRAVEGEHAIVELREEMPAAPPTRGESFNDFLRRTEPGVADWPDELLGPGQTLISLGNGLFRLRWPGRERGVFHDAHGDKAAIEAIAAALRTVGGASAPTCEPCGAVNCPEHGVPVQAGPTSAADILDAMAHTFRERNKVYGSNYKMVAPMMATLFPHGVPPELVVQDKFHLFELLLVKISRFAISHLTHQDSVHDAGVYAAMLEQCINEEKEASK